MSLVVMRPDGGADLALDLRAELRAGWTGPAAWGLLTVGVLLVVGAALLLLRPLRPREVIFVVEPDQVPVLAGRLGVTSLSGLGPRQPDPTPPLPATTAHPGRLRSGGTLPVGDRRRPRAGHPRRPGRAGPVAPSAGGDAESRLAAGRRGPAHGPAGGGPSRLTARPVAVPPADGGGNGEWPSALPTRRATLTGGSVLPERRLR